MRRTVLVALCLSGCASPWTVSEDEGFRHLTQSLESGSGGLAKVKIEVEEGETSMLVTNDPAAPNRGMFENLGAPGGERVYNVDEEWESGLHKTGAIDPGSVVSLNWPILPEDGALEAGKWKADLAMLDTELFYTSGVEAVVDVLFKSDTDLTQGELKVAVVYAGSAADDEDLHDAMADAEEIWAALYAQIGVTLVLTDYIWENGDLYMPGKGSSEDYIGISSMVPLGTIPVVIAPSLREGDRVYGVAGGILGTLVPSDRTAVAVNALVNSGPDGRFDEQETRLLGETIAHEVLHYTGLFHPVEDGWGAWDAVADTPQCTTQVGCAQQLGDNLMYPFPICSANGCTPQDALTEGQGACAHRYTGVR